MFSIEFTDEPLEYPDGEPGIPAAPGRLVLGKCTEEFLANLCLWTKRDYESHWTRELNSLSEGSSKVALIVSYDDPNAGSSLEIWRVYRDGEWVHFQNQLLPYSNLPDGFDILKLSRYIDDRKLVNAEGDRISEWNVATRDIETFLSRSSVR